MEAWRILPKSQEEIPINHYLRIQYALTYDFLTENDLYRTLGVAAAMGIDGAILWNDAIGRISSDMLFESSRVSKT